MSRIYAGSEHTVADIPEGFYEELKFLLADRPDAFAMLEFTSSGKQRRQVDCAIVSPGGIDLIEIKNKTNAVRGTADGQWSTDDGGVLHVFSNRKAGVSENPYQQASNTADDLAWGVAWALNVNKRDVKVVPLVLIPDAHPACEITRHSRVGLALGSDALKGELRAFHWTSGWSDSAYDRLPSLLGLTEIELGSVQLHVMDAETSLPLRHVQVFVDDLEEALVSDFRGNVQFMAALGHTVTLVIEPGTLHGVTELSVPVTHRVNQLGSVAVAPVVTEAARRAAAAQLTQQFERSISDASYTIENLQLFNQALIEGVETERAERQRLERLLAQRPAEGTLPRLARIEREHELARVRAELVQADDTLRELRSTEVQFGDDRRAEAFRTLITLQAGRSLALQGGTPLSVVAAPRFRVTGRRDDVSRRETPAASSWDASHTGGSGAGSVPVPPVAASPRPHNRARHLLVALGGLALLGAAGVTVVLRQPNLANPSVQAVPTVVPLPRSDSPRPAVTGGPLTADGGQARPTQPVPRVATAAAAPDSPAVTNPMFSQEATQDSRTSAARPTSSAAPAAIPAASRSDATSSRPAASVPSVTRAPARANGNTAEGTSTKPSPVPTSQAVTEVVAPLPADVDTTALPGEVVSTNLPQTSDSVVEALPGEAVTPEEVPSVVKTGEALPGEPVSP